MKNKPASNYDKYLDDVELWETRQLGADPKYVRRVSRKKSKEIDAALGLQAISVRLQKELVEQLKTIAKEEGLGYQPLIRHILTRYVKKAMPYKQKRQVA